MVHPKIRVSKSSGRGESATASSIQQKRSQTIENGVETGRAGGG